jgi:hypothetical protein
MRGESLRQTFSFFILSVLARSRIDDGNRYSVVVGFAFAPVE